jgi:hypothetical protein
MKYVSQRVKFAFFKISQFIDRLSNIYFSRRHPGLLSYLIRYLVFTVQFAHSKIYCPNPFDTVRVYCEFLIAGNDVLSGNKPSACNIHKRNTHHTVPEN